MVIKTKRFLYDIFINNISQKTGCNAVIGARKVGKTTLFLQLNEYFGNSSEYFDCTKLINNHDFDFEKYYEDAIHNNKKYIFFDEVCKLDDYYIADFIHLTKLYSSELCICITGSVSIVVRKLLDSIGRGCLYQLPPFMYIEKLCWGSSYDKVNKNVVLDLTSNEKFLTYLKNQMLSPSELVNYMRSVVEDTISSYRERTFLEDIDNISDADLLNALRYISLCQYVYKKSNGEYVNAPSLERNIREKIFTDYKVLKNKFGLNNKTIESTLNILLGCELAHKIYNNFGTLLNVTPLEHTDIVPDIIFEYPWYSSVCFSTDIQNSSQILNQWVEYSILLRAYYIYQSVNKYRSNDEYEIDILYMTEQGYNGLEIKNKPFSNNSSSYINKLNSIAKHINLNSIVISSSDEEYRNDKIACSMELEYIRLIESGELYSRSIISELIK